MNEGLKNIDTQLTSGVDMAAIVSLVDTLQP